MRSHFRARTIGSAIALLSPIVVTLIGSSFTATAAPATVGAWTPTGPVSSCQTLGVGSCQGRTAVLLEGPQCQANPALSFCGKVLLVGSSQEGTPDARDADLYDPRTGRWSAAAQTWKARVNPGAVQIDGPQCAAQPTKGACGKVLVIGGSSADNPRDTAELYDPATNSWALTGRALFYHYFGFSTVLLHGPRCGALCGQVLVAGGAGGYLVAGGGAGTKAEVYDPMSGTWAATGSLTQARNEHVTAYLDGPECATTPTPAYCGDVLVAGGRKGNPSSDSTNTAELFDPSASGAGVPGAWIPTGQLADIGSAPYAPMFATASLLTGPRCGSQCGKVLIAGGVAQLPTTGTPFYKTAELFDPATGTWSLTAPMATARWEHAGVLLPSGEYLVAGGVGPAPLSSAELYDPAAPGGAWTAAPAIGQPSFPFGQPTFGLAATVLSAGPAATCNSLCGRALLTGSDIINAELFEGPPAIGSVTPDPVPLAGGPIVVTGGGFTNVDQVTFDSVAIDCPSAGCSHDPASPDSALDVTAPPHAQGTVTLNVRHHFVDPQIGDSPPFLINYADPMPTVNSLTPSCGPVAGGTVVTINGSHFTPASTVDFAGAQPATVLSPNAIKVTSPAASGPGAASVTVTTSGGTSSPLTFTYPCAATQGAGFLAPSGFAPPSTYTGAPPPAYPGPPPAAQAPPASALSAAPHAPAAAAPISSVMHPAGAQSLGGLAASASDESSGAPSLGYSMVRRGDWDISPALAAGGAVMLSAFGACLFVGGRNGARERRKAAINPVHIQVQEEQARKVWEQ